MNFNFDSYNLEIVEHESNTNDLPLSVSLTDGDGMAVPLVVDLSVFTAYLFPKQLFSKEFSGFGKVESGFSIENSTIIFDELDEKIAEMDKSTFFTVLIIIYIVVFEFLFTKNGYNKLRVPEYKEEEYQNLVGQNLSTNNPTLVKLIKEEFVEGLKLAQINYSDEWDKAIKLLPESLERDISKSAR